MVQIIPAGTPKGPSFSQRLNVGVGKGLEMGQQMMQQAQQRQAMEQAGFGDLVGLDPDLQKIAIAERLKGQNQQNKVMTPLQQSQQALNEERLKQIQGQQQLFEQLKGGGPQPSAEGQPQQGGIQTFPDEGLNELAAFAGQPGQQGVIGNMAKSELERRKELKKESFEREKFEYGKASEKEKIARHEASEITKPLMLELQQARKNIPLQEQAIEDIKNAVPEVSSLDYLADLTGFEPLRSASGAKLKTAIKDFFLSDLSRTGSRPNQWIEQQLADALPKIGRSPEANFIVAEGMQFKVDLAKKRVELIDELAEQDQAKHGYVKGDIDSRASKLLKPFVEQRKKALIDDITSIKKAATPAKGFTRMTNPETGESWDIPAANVKEAKKAGWTAQ